MTPPKAVVWALMFLTKLRIRVSIAIVVGRCSKYFCECAHQLFSICTDFAKVLSFTGLN